MYPTVEIDSSVFALVLSDHFIVPGLKVMPTQDDSVKINIIQVLQTHDLKSYDILIERQFKEIKRFSPKVHFAYAIDIESNAYDKSVPSSQDIPPILHSFVSVN